MDDSANFKRARDNETKERYLGTGWVVFRDFEIVEKTEDNVRVCAKWRDPGLPRPRKLPDGREVQSYSGEWAFKDDNAARVYAPLQEEPDLFLRFASLAEQDPGIEDRDGRLEITMKWIKTYGVLGLTYENGSKHELVYGLRSDRRENLLLFWREVHRAADCITLYQAGTAPARMLKHSNIHGKTTAEKRKSAAQLLSSQLGSKLEHECYPKLYYEVLRETGEPHNVGLSWGFRSLLGAMYLQLVWRIKSRQCQAPGCNNIIGLDRRSDAETCSQRCKERRRYHHDRAADKRPATSRSATTSLD
jgi:hypothetical protein